MDAESIAKNIEYSFNRFHSLTWRSCSPCPQSIKKFLKKVEKAQDARIFVIRRPSGPREENLLILVKKYSKESTVDIPLSKFMDSDRTLRWIPLSSISIEEEFFGRD